MWPLIRDQSGNWYPAGLSDSDLHGLQSYQIFISIAMILGNGLYNIFKVLSMMIFIFIAMILGDGLYNIFKVLSMMIFTSIAMILGGGHKTHDEA